MGITTKTLAAGSLACFLALTASGAELWSSYIAKPNKSAIEASINAPTSQYANICAKLVQAHHDYFFMLALSQNIDPHEKEELKALLARVRKVEKTAKNRIKAWHFDGDEQVFYSARAFSSLIESVLDDDFMELTGGLSVDVVTSGFDIVAFGRGVQEADRYFKNT